jgi:ribose transport system permease protein
VFGINYVILIAIALGALFHYVLKHTTYGRSLAALGQNYDAAYFAGIKVQRVEIASYMLCSLLAALAGLLISLRVGGAFLGMGDSYMLETVGGVVIGGTLISGGKPSAIGVLLGCLFLTLVMTAMQVARFDIGLQNIVKGLLIVLVIIVGTESLKKADKA